MPMGWYHYKTLKVEGSPPSNVAKSFDGGLWALATKWRARRGEVLSASHAYIGSVGSVRSRPLAEGPAHFDVNEPGRPGLPVPVTWDFDKCMRCMQGKTHTNWRSRRV